jgi:hypothetical protein
MKKKLLTATFLLIFAVIGARAQGSQNINRAYGLTISNSKGLVDFGTICFYKYSANGPELVTYYYTDMVTKVKATISFTNATNTGTPPDMYTIKAKEERVWEQLDMKVIYQLLDKNKIQHPNGAAITQMDPQSAAGDVRDFVSGN